MYTRTGFWLSFLGIFGLNNVPAAAAMPPSSLQPLVAARFDRTIHQDAEGNWAVHAGQRLITRFGRESTSVTTAAGTIEFRFAGCGRDNRITAGAINSAIRVEKNRLFYDRGALTEWYINDEQGLEQGFTVTRRPPGRGAFVVALSIGPDVTAVLAERNTVNLVRHGRTFLRYGGLKAWDAGGRRLESRLEVRHNQIRLVVDDGQAEYPLTIDPWVQNTKLVALGGAPADFAGYSVAASDHTAIVGAYGKNQVSGAAYIYARNGGAWVQQAELAPADGAPANYFGISVALSGDTVLIGATGHNDFQGAAYVFVRNGTTWTQQAKLTALDGTVGDIFGWSVALDGDTALIGAFAKNSSMGAAYVFERHGSSWVQQAKLTAPDGAPKDYFGWSVALRRNHAIVGAYGKNTNTGAAYLYARHGETWSLAQQVTAPDGSPNDYFGYSVAVSERLAAIGAFGADEFRGRVYAFERSGTAWGARGTLTASDGIAGDDFGYSVAVRGQVILVGAWGRGGAMGAAYLYLPGGTGWNQATTLTAADGMSGDFFGWAVALAGDAAIVGAYGGSGFSGAAYAFANPCTVGLELTYTSGNLLIGYTVGAADSGRWSGWLWSQGGVKRLWEKGLEPSQTPLTGSSQISNFPVSGPIGVMATLTTSTGSRCADFQTINTTGSEITPERRRAMMDDIAMPLP